MGAKGFFLSSFNAEHNGCTGVAKATARQVAEMSTAISLVQGDPTISGKQIARQVKAQNGVDIGNRMSYRVRDSIKSSKMGTYEESCQRLPSLLRLFEEVNPGTHTAVELDGDCRFRRAFLSNPDAARHQNKAQRILGFDGSFMKTLNQKNTMLILVGRDGNNKNIVMAVALVPSEDTANCQWFVLNCLMAGIETIGIPFFMDRGKAGIAAATTFGLQLHFCTRHIAGNMTKKFKALFTPDLQKRLYKIQQSKSAEEFESRLLAFGINNSEMEAYVRNIVPANWALYPYVDTIKLYKWRTTNFVESENGRALPARELFPSEFFSHFMESFMATKY
ncbi:hypothetical protein PR001_g7613, partial [Phytophthora rubi]